jgi:hypothetical protein
MKCVKRIRCSQCNALVLHKQQISASQCNDCAYVYCCDCVDLQGRSSDIEYCCECGECMGCEHCETGWDYSEDKDAYIHEYCKK